MASVWGCGLPVHRDLVPLLRKFVVVALLRCMSHNVMMKLQYLPVVLLWIVALTTVTFCSDACQIPLSKKTECPKQPVQNSVNSNFVLFIPNFELYETGVAMVPNRL